MSIEMENPIAKRESQEVAEVQEAPVDHEKVQKIRDKILNNELDLLNKMTAQESALKIADKDLQQESDLFGKKK